MGKKIKQKSVISFLLVFVMVLTLMPEVIANAIATGAPGKAQMQHNQWGEDVDGNYDLSVNMWYGNNGTSYTLYERFGLKGEFKAVEKGDLIDQSPNPQNFVIPIKGREKVGMYYYYLELENAFGKSQGDVISVKVGGGDVSNIILEGIDDARIEAQFTVEQGKTEIKLINNATQSKKYTVLSNNLTVAKATMNGDILVVEGIEAGRSGLKIVDEKSGEVRYVGVRVKEKDGKLPGIPKYVSIGQVSEDTKNDLDFWKDFDTDDTNKRCDIRYIYINGGPINGWRNQTSEDGSRAKKYITESLKLGMIPYFVFYNIPDSAEDYNIDLRHINDKDYMKAYYEDLKYFLDIINEYAGDETVGIVLEPDFLGYMMQQSGKRPNQIEAAGVESAYTSGVLTKGVDPEFQNSVTGVCESINYIISEYAKNVTFGWQFNTWGYAEQGVPSQGLMHATEKMGWDKGREFIKQAAEKTAQYYMDAGILSYGADFISIDKYGLDGAFESGAANDPENSMWLWNADMWNNYLFYTKVLHETTQKPVTLWQLPVGHLNQSQEPNPYAGGLFPNLTNVNGNFEDSAPTFFFGDTFKPGAGKRFDYFATNIAKDPKVKVNGDTITYEGHMEEAMDAGVTTVLFGAGVGTSTDCVGSPPADNYWWITKAQRYLKNPVLLKKEDEKPIPDAEDVNGDGKVDIVDLAAVALAYNTKPYDSGWKSKYDINSDNIIDLYDLVSVSKKIM
ncbi:MAG: dockerin type I domain-containing protein [Clostridium sp.]